MLEEIALHYGFCFKIFVRIGPIRFQICVQAKETMQLDPLIFNHGDEFSLWTKWTLYRCAVKERNIWNFLPFLGKISAQSEIIFIEDFPHNSAEVRVEMESLENGNEVEDWYALSGLTHPVREDWGSIRIRSRFLHEVIMPVAEYNSLKEVRTLCSLDRNLASHRSGGTACFSFQLILDERLEAVMELSELCHRDRTPLATSVLRVFRFAKKTSSLLTSMNDKEISKEGWYLAFLLAFN